MRTSLGRKKDWLAQQSRDSRRAPRLTERELVVNYWDGAVPDGRGLRDVSESGAYIQTNEKWYAGTIVRVIFKGSKPIVRKDGTPGPPASICITAQIVRQAPDGIAMEFVFKTKREREAFRVFLESIPEQAKTPAVSPAPGPAVAPTENRTRELEEG